MRCKKHKRYEAKLRPRCSCLECWMMYIESHLDIGIINDSIKHQEEFHGGWSIEYGDTNDNLVINYLLEKKRELEMKADCNICKNKGHDCLMNPDGTCDNFKLDCHICVNRFAMCFCPAGEYCTDFDFTESEDNFEVALEKLKAGIIKGEKNE